MAMNWTGIWNRLWRIIDSQGDCYFSGPRFLNTIRDFNMDLPDYGEFIELRRRADKSTSRKDYFRDVLMELDEPLRVRALNAILEQVEHADAERVTEIRAIIAGGAAGPRGEIPPETWNADRLNRMLGEIDEAIGLGQFERAVALAYTCLEGFYGAFFRANAPNEPAPNEIIALSRWIRNHLRATIQDYPDEVINLIGQTAHAVDRARNRFSEAHFANEAGRWLAMYVRDLVNSQVRLLINFM